jgi:hypothetical protein
MKIELPRTLEEITVWALENSTLCNSEDSYRSLFTYQLWHKGTAQLSVDKLHQRILAWLKDIAPLEGAVTHRPQKHSVMYYRVSVAGIWICTVNEQEKDEIFGVQA